MRGTVLLLLVLAAAGAAFLWWQDAPRQSRPVSVTPALQIHQSPEDAPSTIVRVNLTPAPVKQLDLQIDGPFELRPVGSNQSLGRGERLESSDLRATATGVQIGSRAYPTRQLEVVPASSPAVWIDSHQYRGTVQLHCRPDGTLLAINHVPLEDYVASVIDSEMPAAFPEAARQAQAIVARTYVLYQMTSSHPLFDVYATTQSQKYLGFQYRDATGRRLAGESENSRKIARETAGIVLTYGRTLFCTYYSAVCGGRTTPGDQVFKDAAPPLRSVACRWCEAARLFRWTARVRRSDVAADVRRHFAASGRPFGALHSLARVEGAAYDHRAVFRVSDGRRQYDLSAAELRRHLPSASLHSPHFDLRAEGDVFLFEGRGHGHGVGFCQWGARGQGLAGRTALEILRSYYPGAEPAIVQGNR